MVTTSKPDLNHRREHRVPDTLLVSVRATNPNGQRIKINTITDNISSGGVFMQLPYFLTLNSQLFAFIRISNNVGLAAMGRVVRTESKKPGLLGIAMCFSQTRLLPFSELSKISGYAEGFTMD